MEACGLVRRKGGSKSWPSKRLIFIAINILHASTTVEDRTSISNVNGDSQGFQFGAIGKHGTIIFSVSHVNHGDVERFEMGTAVKHVIEIAAMLGYKDKRSVRKLLNPLIESGRIAMTIPDKPNSRNQKY